jgi:anaerobic selenocysteine-containing dehydrogenase
MGEKKENWTWEEDGMKVVRSVARTGPGCHEGCGVRLYVKDGKLVKVMGDPNSPFSQGRLCPRCLALPEVVYHPDRLKYPLKRVGERGEDKWERITWNEALDTIADKFNQYKTKFGAESVFFCQGTGRDIKQYITKLAYAFGRRSCLPCAKGHDHACHYWRI